MGCSDSKPAAVKAPTAAPAKAANTPNPVAEQKGISFPSSTIFCILPKSLFDVTVSNSVPYFPHDSHAQTWHHSLLLPEPI